MISVKFFKKVVKYGSICDLYAISELQLIFSAAKLFYLLMYRKHEPSQNAKVIHVCFYVLSLKNRPTIFKSYGSLCFNKSDAIIPFKNT